MCHRRCSSAAPRPLSDQFTLPASLSGTCMIAGQLVRRSTALFRPKRGSGSQSAAAAMAAPLDKPRFHMAGASGWCNGEFCGGGGRARGGGWTSPPHRRSRLQIPTGPCSMMAPTTCECPLLRPRPSLLANACRARPRLTRRQPPADPSLPAAGNPQVLPARARQRPVGLGLGVGPRGVHRPGERHGRSAGAGGCAPTGTLHPMPPPHAPCPLAHPHHPPAPPPPPARSRGGTCRPPSGPALGPWTATAASAAAPQWTSTARPPSSTQASAPRPPCQLPQARCVASVLAPAAAATRGGQAAGR